MSEPAKKEGLSPWAKVGLAIVAAIAIAVFLPMCSQGVGQSAENTFMHRPAIEWNMSKFILILLVGALAYLFFKKDGGGGGGGH